MTTAVLERPKTGTDFPDSCPVELRTEEVFDGIEEYAKKCIEEGLRDIEEGRVISDEEMRKSLAKWL